MQSDGAGPAAVEPIENVPTPQSPVHARVVLAASPYRPASHAMQSDDDGPAAVDDVEYRPASHAMQSDGDGPAAVDDVEYLPIAQLPEH